MADPQIHAEKVYTSGPGGDKLGVGLHVPAMNVLLIITPTQADALATEILEILIEAELPKGNL